MTATRARRDYRLTDQPGIAPELVLVAAVLDQAMRDARAGCPRARRWLVESAPALLTWLLPEHADLRVVHDRLLERAQGERRWFRRVTLSDRRREAA